MRTQTFLLTLLVFVGGLAFGQTPSDRIVHPIDSLMETDKYIIYKTDTFNIRDNRGLIQGKGIWILKDSTISRGMSSHTLGYHDNSKVATCVSHKDPDNIYYKVKEIFFGQYRDNLMTGIWTCNWTNGKRRIELTFDKGKTQGQVNLYYDTGELMYSGVAVNGQDKIELNKFRKGGLQAETNKYRLADIIDYLTY